MSKSIGMLALCAFLIITGLLAVTNITFAFAGVVLGILALVAGICLLLGY